MTVNCDFCQKDISHLDQYPYYIGEKYKCSCGKNSCSEECHEFISTILGSDEYFTNICKKEAIQYGTKGMIFYLYRRNGFDYDVITEDPDYQPMVQELEELRKQVSILKEENKDLRTHIDLMPDGKEYLAAKERFEQQDY